MRCRICDNALTEAEIEVTVRSDGYEPCKVCLDIAMDAAYCNGFVREDPLDDPELDNEFGNGSVETIDPDTFISELDPDDTSHS